MYAANLLRLSSQVMHSIMGGVAIFCLYYSTQIPDSGWLLIEALKWGMPAAAIVFFQERYLSK